MRVAKLDLLATFSLLLHIKTEQNIWRLKQYESVSFNHTVPE